MRVFWLAGLAACFAVQGCAPPPGAYYGAPPGYAPQPYAATPGAVGQPLLPPADGALQDADPGYADPGYAEPAYVQPGYPVPAVAPGYGYAPPPPPAFGYVPPPPVFGGGYDRFFRHRDRERFERERFERSRFRERLERSRPPPPPPGQALQGPARPQDFRRPPDGGPRRGLSPEQLRGLP